VAVTVWTGQLKAVVLELPVELLVDPPAPDVVSAELTTSGVTPNRSPYTVVAAMVPVATD
jgi:hypothetical protein